MRLPKVGAMSACVVAALVALGACGGDGGEPSGAGPASGSTGDGGEGTAPTGSSTPTDPACEGPPFTFALRAADAVAGLEPFEAPDLAITDTVAVKVNDAAYTLYLADYDIDRSAIGVIEAPHPPRGKILITLAITVFNAEGEPPPIEVGDVIPAGAEFGEQTFIVIVERGDDMYSSSPAASGEVHVLGLDAGGICVAVDYQDLEDDTTLNGEQQASPVQKHLVGTVAADVMEMGY